MKLIAVDGCTFSITVGGLVIGEGNVSVTGTASTNTKIDQKGVYTGPLAISVAGYTDIAISGGSGVGVISSTAKSVKVDSLPVILQGDSGEVALSGTNPSSDAPVTGYPVTVKVLVAGQTSVQGE